MDRFSVETTVFSGPLDALLNLIEERKLSISQVSLAEVCDAYLAYVEKLPSLPLPETAQFVLVASTLLLIKSRTLLPSLSLTEEERESVAELERRLAHYALIRKAAKGLRKAWGRPLLLTKRAPVAPSVFSPAESSIASIATAAKRLVSILPKGEALMKAAVAPVLALEDVIRQLKNRLTVALQASFRELTRSRSKHDTIVYFLATLELVRSGSISATQERLFSDIMLESESSGTPRYGT
ncbi:segregation/condensation protein A [Candidatus Kaiserbacteria bacterium]|nr:segregation/condensation protein A [Candidatus Kaiserbacteria bacterium]